MLRPRLGVAASLSGAGGTGGAACPFHMACTSSVQCRVGIHKYLLSDLPLPDETEVGRRLMALMWAEQPSVSQLEPSACKALALFLRGLGSGPFQARLSGWLCSGHE